MMCKISPGIMLDHDYWLPLDMPIVEKPIIDHTIQPDMLPDHWWSEWGLRK